MKAKPPAGPGIVSQEYEMVPVGALAPHPRNVNVGDVAAIVESIRHNRFFGAVTAQKSSGLILCGKHRWLAAQECGLELVPTIWADVDDEAAVRMMLVDNRTARLGADDPEALAQLLTELQNDGGLLGTGFDQGSLDTLLADLAGPVAPDDFAEKDESIETEHRCPKCGYEWSGKQA